MANQTNPYQQAQQQIEQQRSKLGSSRALRAIEGIRGLVSRQKATAQLSQTESEVQQRMQEFEQLQRQQEEQFSSSQNYQKQMQEALRVLVEKGKGSSALYSLSKQDRARVEEIAADIKRQRQQSVISAAEKQYSMSLTPELKAEIVAKAESAGKVGASSFELPNLEQRAYEKIAQTQQIQYTPIKLEQPIQTTPVYGPQQEFMSRYQTKPQYYLEQVKRRIENVGYLLSRPEKEFQKFTSALGEKAQQYAESSRTSNQPRFRLGPTGFPEEILYTPTPSSYKETPEQIGQKVKSLANVGSYFVPGIGEARFATYGADVLGKSLRGDKKAIAEAGLLLGGLSIYKGVKGIIKSEVPQYTTNYLGIASPERESMNILTVARTERKTAKGTDVFYSLLGQKGVATEDKFLSTGLGMVRPSEGGNIEYFRTLSTGKIKEAKPFKLTEYLGEEIIKPASKSPTASMLALDVVPKKAELFIEIPGAKQTRGLSGFLKDNLINLERTDSTIIPAFKNKLFFEASESSMSGKAKGFTFFIKPSVVEEKGFEFITPSGQVTKTPFAVTFPKGQVESAIEKSMIKTTPKPIPFIPKATGTAVSRPTTKSQDVFIGPRTQRQGIVYDVDYLSDKIENLPRQAPRILIDVRNRAEEDLIIVPRGVPGVTTVPKPSSSLFFATAQKSGQSTMQELLRIQVNLPQFPRTPSIPRPPTKPTKPIIPFLEDDDIIRKKGIKGFKGVGDYISEIKRFNKWMPLGRSKSFSEATARAIFGARETLGQSIRVRKGTQLIQIPVVKGFKTSKKNPLVLVQKRGTTLATRGERVEIIRAKRAKSVRFFK